MATKKKPVTLTNSQKYELCLYANHNKLTRRQYVDWVEQKWKVRVDESTITRILQTQNKRLSSELINPEHKRNRSVMYSELELALKEFVLRYQIGRASCRERSKEMIWRSIS